MRNVKALYYKYQLVMRISWVLFRWALALFSNQDHFMLNSFLHTSVSAYFLTWFFLLNFVSFSVIKPTASKLGEKIVRGYLLHNCCIMFLKLSNLMPSDRYASPIYRTHYHSLLCYTRTMSLIYITSIDSTNF